MTKGRFISFEGGEGSGKSTQAKLLAGHIGGVLTREPGGTDLGERIRDLVLDPSEHSVDIRCETLLLIAARAQHVFELILPLLESGTDVVSDRFSYATLAYQGYGRGLDTEELRGVCDWATGGIWPDVNILLDVPDDIANARVDSRAELRDRLESEPQAFHEWVREGYKALSSRDPDHWIVVDGSGTIGEVAAKVTQEYEAWRNRG